MNINKLFLTTLLSFSFLSFANAGEIIKAPVKVGSAAFAKMLYQAYQQEGRQPDGRVFMPRLFTCHKVGTQYSCALQALEWMAATAPSGMAFKLFTPVTDDAIFDAMEYMQIRPTVTEDQNSRLLSKSLSLIESGKHYSLNCTVATSKRNQHLVFSQCTFFNGIQDDGN